MASGNGPGRSSIRSRSSISFAAECWSGTARCRTARWRTARELLARPDDARHPHHVAARDCAFRVIGIERLQLHLLGALPLELLAQDLALAGPEHHAVAAADGRGRRHDDDVTVAIGRGHRIAGDFQRIGVIVADPRKAHRVPALAGRKAGIVEIAARAGLGEAEIGFPGVSDDHAYAL